MKQSPSSTANSNSSSVGGSSKSALGKGLSSLIKAANPIPASAEALGQNYVNGGEFLYVHPKEIEPNPYQPRKEFDAGLLEELAQSIKEQGLIQPLIVQKKQNGGYELIAGERRLRACKMAMVEKIPVVVKTTTDRGKLLLAIIENVQRSELNIVDEAKAYFQLIEEFNLSQEQVASKVGKSRPSIANILRILKLPSDVLGALKENKISFGHAKILLGIEDKKEQLQYFQLILEKKLSVRDIEELLKKNQAALETQDGKLDDKELENQKLEKEIKKRLKLFKDNLENKTGFHFHLNWNLQGAGNVSIKFNSKEEFNQIYDYLLKSR